MVTVANLEDLAVLAAQATPGPWFVRHLDDDHCMGAIGISTAPDDGEAPKMSTFHGPGPELIAATLIQAPPYVVSKDGRWEENARLVVALRNALPELLRLAAIGARLEADA
ncbi:hypothetical protein AB2M62_19395 [Sphingomonas sp. MMS12-HWE2-04]|uniref:hypothetical protein n=1 Tax=Sphingomonas sp. MMS12-HWE2-04 TaxID=3234199 RepID=UPI00384AF988